MMFEQLNDFMKNVSEEEYERELDEEFKELYEFNKKLGNTIN